jgi:hypothetical protein
MAKTPARLALKAALKATSKETWLKDSAFIARWINQADDPVFEWLGDALAKHLKIEGDSGGLRAIYSLVIACALTALQTAREVRAGRDPTVEAAKKDRDKALELAQKADDLATFHRGIGGVSGKLDLASLLLPVSARPNLASVLGPWAELDVSFRQHGMMPLQQLGELHQREANLLRQFASKELPRPRTRISRYRQGREHVAFMYSMVSSMRELCGAPQNEALAAITNIAFPDADATAEMVRSSCRPTTRSDRRRKSGAHSRKGRA